MKAVNLIPSEQRVTAKVAPAGAKLPNPSGGAFGAYIVLGVLVFAVVATALYVMANNSIKDNEAQLAQVEQQAQSVEAQASALQSFADFKQLADARVETVKGLADARFPWAATLTDVSRALPSDVFISSLDGATSASANGGSSLRGAIAAPSVELNGCTRDQASVARLMSSLRGIRGVSRVTLSKSESSDQAAASGASAPAPATNADGTTPTVATQPCPKGSPPAFDLIVFFERVAVDASAAPNSGASTTAGPTGASGAQSGPTGASPTTPTTSTP